MKPIFCINTREAGKPQSSDCQSIFGEGAISIEYSGYENLTWSEKLLYNGISYFFRKLGEM